MRIFVCLSAFFLSIAIDKTNAKNMNANRMRNREEEKITANRGDHIEKLCTKCLYLFYNLDKAVEKYTNNMRRTAVWNTIADSEARSNAQTHTDTNANAMKNAKKKRICILRTA